MNLNDTEYLFEGKFTKNFINPDSLPAFYDFLDNSANNYPTKAQPGVILYDGVREAITRLNKMYTAVIAGSNKSRLTSDTFLMNVFDFLLALDNEVNNEDPELTQVISWKSVLNFIYANGTKFNSKNIENFGKEQAELFIDSIKRKELKKLRSTSEYKTSVKAALEIFAPKVEKATNGQYKIILQTRKNSAPIILDTVNQLQITARNYNEWLYFTRAKDVDEFVSMIKNMFDNQYGKSLGSDIIPEGTTFNYKSDALIACDFGKLTTADGDFNSSFEAGFRKLSDDKTILQFIHPGLSLRSRSDMIQGVNRGEGESRYWNEFNSDKSYLTIGLNTNENFDGIYLTRNVNRYIFEIVQDDGSQEYVSCGTYVFDHDNSAENKGKPTEVTYKRISTNIKRINTTVSEKYNNVEIAEMLDEAFAVIAKHGYGVAKNKATNFDAIVQARIIAERNGYRVKKIR